MSHCRYISGATINNRTAEITWTRHQIECVVIKFSIISLNPIKAVDNAKVQLWVNCRDTGAAGHAAWRQCHNRMIRKRHRVVTWQDKTRELSRCRPSIECCVSIAMGQDVSFFDEWVSADLPESMYAARTVPKYREQTSRAAGLISTAAFVSSSARTTCWITQGTFGFCILTNAFVVRQT